MKKCDVCGKQNGRVPINIIIKDGIKETVYCPNCMTRAFLENKLNFVNDPSLIDDITGQAGAVEYIATQEHYVLEKEAMLRLISHSLRLSEY